MKDKHQELMTKLVIAVYHGKGVTDRSLRSAIKTAFAPNAKPLENDESLIPANLKSYLYKISRCAYKVTDRDVETLKAQGYSEEVIFELTVSAAVGAGLGRLQQGIGALNGCE